MAKVTAKDVSLGAQELIKQFMDFADEGKPDPVVITIDGIDSDNLLTEKGEDISWELDFLEKFGYFEQAKHPPQNRVLNHLCKQQEIGHNLLL